MLVLEAKLKIKSRGTTFIYGVFQVSTRNWEKKEEKGALSGCYSNAGEQCACFSVGGCRRPFLPLLSRVLTRSSFLGHDASRSWPVSKPRHRPYHQKLAAVLIFLCSRRRTAELHSPAPFASTAAPRSNSPRPLLRLATARALSLLASPRIAGASRTPSSFSPSSAPVHRRAPPSPLKFALPPSP